MGGLVHGMNYVQIRPSVGTQDLKHARHSEDMRLRSDKDPHRVNRERRRSRRQLSYRAAGNCKLGYSRDISNAATRRVGRHIFCHRRVAIQQNGVCHSAREARAQDVVPGVEFDNKGHRKFSLNTAPALGICVTKRRASCLRIPGTRRSRYALCTPPSASSAFEICPDHCATSSSRSVCSLD